ncbi:MAG: hypothetical protein RL219_884 [Actinomycetota bacterium]|jgi:hypothetical protein
MHKEARLSDELFSREEIQGGGLSRVRRARALLYLIEQEARRVKDRRAAMVTAAPEAGLMLNMLWSTDAELMRRDLPGEADAAFIESFRNARRGTGGGETKALDSTASAWKVLLPAEMPLRAEVLRQMSLRHEMPRNKSKHIAEAFGVGDPAFEAAYQKATGQPASSAFAPEQGLFASLRGGKRSSKG